MSSIDPKDWKIDPQQSGHLFSLHNNLLSQVSLPSNINPQNMYLFNHQVKTKAKATNQKQSGRCWIFAALNFMRSKFIEANKLPTDFEFSESYLFFWDKFERMNYLINKFETMKDTDLNDRTLQFLLKDPMCDGGQWQMFVNLVEKYGLVPKSVCPETTHTSNSSGINMILSKKLREYCSQIRDANSAFDKKKALKETYDILVKFFGVPPSEPFTWEYKDKDGKFQRKTELSPQKLYKELSSINLKDYVSLTNDPRNDFDTIFCVDHLNNIQEGDPVLYYNVEINKMKDALKKSIDDNEPVWFGCDVGQFLHSKTNILDKNIFDMESYLNITFKLNKKERMQFGDSLMTHAMLITGYHEDEFGVIDRWEIENSWGHEGPNGGFYVMSHEWFKNYVYQITVHNKYLLENDREKAMNSDKSARVILPPWDPMGSLAKL